MMEKFGTVEELLTIVRKMQSQVLFRGHCSAEFKLIPSIGRSHHSHSQILKLEKTLFSRFKLLSRPYLSAVPETDLDWLILARHYGLNTRLLDWTSSIYVALYFSLLNRKNYRNEPFSVIIYPDPKISSYDDLRKTNPFNTREDLFFEPPHIDSRITNQGAFMSLHKSPFSDVANKSLLQFNLYPSPDHIKTIEMILIDIGIKHSTIYPGMDGIARHLNDNPNALDANLSLNPEKTSWRPVPKWMRGELTVGEINDLIIAKRHLPSLLHFYAERIEEIIGIPIEKKGEVIGVLRSYIPDEEKVVILRNDGFRKMVVDLTGKDADVLMTPKKILDSLFNGNIKFIRPI